METHLQLTLHDGFVSAARLVSRLHALNVGIAELHTAGDRLCIHLTDGAPVARVRGFLDRCADATLSNVVQAESAPCLQRRAQQAPRRTTYVVTSEPIASRAANRGGRGLRVLA